MKHRPLLFVALVAIVALGSDGAHADGGPVALRASPPLGKDMAAFPRIDAPASNAAAARINLGLVALDKKFKAAAADCNHGEDATRSIEVTLAGTRYLGLVTHDEWSCGAYPDTGSLALVYDLGSGRPVNWAALLPGSLAVKGSTDTYFDGSVIGMLGSKALSALYWNAIKADPDNADCHDVVMADDVTFQAWPAAKDDAVALEPASLPHAEKACAITALVPTATLRKMGANAALLDDIDAAHARR